ncbi:CheR family methyltransferase [Sulfurimonas sp.]|uniref:CheR family methyltransferase n=1 Tax=Sulfurimonas sp. TaxID=2022749 RepID=UPI002AB1F079|nr:CheR family methyltransferase [Sulfurimonas sp.]
MGLFNWLSINNTNQNIHEEVTPIVNDFSHFKQVTNYIYEKSGIADLDTRALSSSILQKFADEQNIHITAHFLQMMKSNDKFYQDVMNIVTVNETYFLREEKELKWLVSYIKRSSHNLKILSIPSSSGEEVYSILILLNEAGVDLKKIQITGYDINSSAIKKARNASYKKRPLHKLNANLKAKYFNIDENNSYKISPFIKNQANFKQNNIFDLHNEINKFDIVLSRNMFIYFDNEKRLEALNIIINLLKPDGIYIKGHADHIHPHKHLQSLKFGIYKKVL